MTLSKHQQKITDHQINSLSDKKVAKPLNNLAIAQ